MISALENLSYEKDEDFEIVSSTNSEITSTEMIPAEKTTTGDTSDTNTEGEPSLFSRLAEDNLELDPALVKEARNGVKRSINYIGSLYHHRQEYKIAMKWLELAAEKNFPPALCMIGSMYKEGQGVDTDLLAAMSWFLKAAKFGYQDACNEIAEMFGNGLGVPEDGEKALAWYRAGEVPTKTTVETIEEDYITVTKNDESILKLVVEAREILEHQMEKRWKDKIEKLNEEITSLHEVTNALVNDIPSPAQHRW